MKLGLLVVLAVVVVVPGLSEGRIVSRCELKQRLEETLRLPWWFQGRKERILASVICELERRYGLDTSLVRGYGKRKTTTTTKPMTTTSTTTRPMTTRPGTTRPTTTRPGTTRPTTTRPRTTRPTQRTSPSTTLGLNQTAGNRQKREADKTWLRKENTFDERESEQDDNSANTEDEDRDMGDEDEPEQDDKGTDVEEEQSDKRDEDEPEQDDKGTDDEEEESGKRDEDEPEQDDKGTDDEEEESDKRDEDEPGQDDNGTDDEEEESDKRDEELEVKEGGKRKKRYLYRWWPRRKVRRPTYYGLFQLSDSYYCKSQYRRSRNKCRTTCTAFTDDDIMDDVDCFVKSYRWKWLYRRASFACCNTRNFFSGCE